MSKYTSHLRHPNIRFVGALYNKDLTFISKTDLNIISSYQMNDLTIGCIKNSVDQVRLNLYLEATNNETCRVIEYNNIQTLFTSFRYEEIDILFICCAHPSPYIIELSNSESIRIIDCQTDFNNTKISYLIPLIRKNKIENKKIFKTIYFNLSFLKCSY